MSGEDLFNRYCAVCHGVGASGRMGPPLNQLPPEIAELPPEQVGPLLEGLLRNGIPGAMPRFLPEQLGSGEIVEIVRYLFAVNESVPEPSLYTALEPVAQAPAGGVYFAETGHSVSGEFLQFWRRYGGLRVFGLPLTEEYNGVSPEDGNVYRMQMFERARLEYHPENSPAYRVQMALIGSEELRLRTHFFLLHAEEGGEAGAPGEE
jgi:hypothetical protein